MEINGVVFEDDKPITFLDPVVGIYVRAMPYALNVFKNRLNKRIDKNGLITYIEYLNILNEEIGTEFVDPLFRKTILKTKEDKPFKFTVRKSYGVPMDVWYLTFRYDHSILPKLV